MYIGITARLMSSFSYDQKRTNKNLLGGWACVVKVRRREVVAATGRVQKVFQKRIHINYVVSAGDTGGSHSRTRTLTTLKKTTSKGSRDPTPQFCQLRCDVRSGQVIASLSFATLVVITYRESPLTGRWW